MRSVTGPWTPTGEYRIAPWHLGLMRAEQQQRRDITFPDGEAGPLFQLRWVRYRVRDRCQRLDRNFYGTMAGDTILRRMVTWLKT